MNEEERKILIAEEEKRIFDSIRFWTTTKIFILSESNSKKF